jgi:chaperonin cofactor prefoldin
VPKKKRKKKQKHISNQSLAQIIGASAAVVMKDRVAEEIKGFTEIIGRVYQTYKKGGPHGTPLSLNIMRSSTGEAKKAAIEASLSLKVVPATAPHFHLCLNSTYLEECIQKNVSPEPLMAIKISHVRRYRAANVRNDQSKMKKNSQLNLKGADADFKANSIYSNNKEKLMGNGFVQSFDEDSIKFIRKQTTDLPGRSKRLQNLHKEIQTKLNAMQEMLNLVETASGKDLPPSKRKVAAESGGESKANDVDEPAAKGRGESAEEEEMSKDIGQLLSKLGDNKEAQSVKSEYTKIKGRHKRAKKGIEASKNKLNKLIKEKKGKAKIDKVTEQLQDKKDRLKKVEIELHKLIHKITSLSEKKIPIK